MDRDAEFDEWWMKEPVGEFSGVDARHVERAFAAGRKAEREACARLIESSALSGGKFAAEWIRKRSNMK